jgi:hypothetical protein
MESKGPLKRRQNAWEMLWLIGHDHLLLSVENALSGFIEHFEDHETSSQNCGDVKMVSQETWIYSLTYSLSPSHPSSYFDPLMPKDEYEESLVHSCYHSVVRGTTKSILVHPGPVCLTDAAESMV